MQIFVFNPFQVNTYLLHDGEGNALVIDPGMYETFEQITFQNYLRDHALKPVILLNTHCHIDHILGNVFVKRQYNPRFLLHPESLPILEQSRNDASLFGFDLEIQPKADDFLEQGDTFSFGKSLFEVRYCPGHVNGSICLINHNDRVVFVGDVLFRRSIGRTDLPTGDFETLMRSIKEQLLSLDDDYVVYPGHGPETTIGEERRKNPFLA